MNFLSSALSSLRAWLSLQPVYTNKDRTVTRADIPVNRHLPKVRCDRLEDKTLVKLPCRALGPDGLLRMAFDIGFLVQRESPYTSVTQETVNCLLPEAGDVDIVNISILSGEVIKCHVIPPGYNILGNDFFTLNNMTLIEDQEGTIIAQHD